MRNDDIDKVRDAIRDDAASVAEIQRATDLNDKRLFAALDALDNAGQVKVTKIRSKQGHIMWLQYKLEIHP